jgi:hypothetical protein
MISSRIESALAQKRNRPEHLERRLQAYHIWGTIGLDFFLTREGSILRFTPGKVPDEDEGTVEKLEQEVEVNAALTAATPYIPELGELLPKRPSTAIDCPICHGAGNTGIYIICERCSSVGWIDDRICDS